VHQEIAELVELDRLAGTCSERLLGRELALRISRASNMTAAVERYDSLSGRTIAASALAATSVSRSIQPLKLLS
jgi:hypothetical protein